MKTQPVSEKQEKGEKKLEPRVNNLLEEESRIAKEVSQAGNCSPTL